MARDRMVISINALPIEVPSGARILDAIRLAGIEIPTLCHDDRPVPTGACRLCLVHVEGWNRLVPSCATPVASDATRPGRSTAVSSARAILRNSPFMGRPSAVASFVCERPPFATAPITRASSVVGLADAVRPDRSAGAHLKPPRYVYRFASARSRTSAYPSARHAEGFIIISNEIR